MGLMSRAGTVVKAKFSKLLDRAEDPGETLDYSYEKQLELLQNVKRGVADVVTAKKRLQLQTNQLEQSIVKLEPLLRGDDVGDAALHVLEQLELLLVRVIGRLRRILGAVEQLRELRLDDRPGA